MRRGILQIGPDTPLYAGAVLRLGNRRYAPGERIEREDLDTLRERRVNQLLRIRRLRLTELAPKRAPSCVFVRGRVEEPEPKPAAEPEQGASFDVPEVTDPEPTVEIVAPAGEHVTVAEPEPEPEPEAEPEPEPEAEPEAEVVEAPPTAPVAEVPKAPAEPKPAAKKGKGKKRKGAARGG